MQRAIAALITLLVFFATPAFARHDHGDEVQAPRTGGPERGGSQGIQAP